MKLTARHEFAAPCDTVFAMTVDPAFLAQASRDLGAPDADVTASPTADGGAVTRISVQLPTPEPVVAFAGRTVTVGQEMTWGPAAPDGSRTARVFIKLAGLPATMDATARLAPTASGSAIDYDGELTVAVPVLGSMLEKQAAPFVLETLDAQQASGDAWLATRAR